MESYSDINFTHIFKESLLLVEGAENELFLIRYMNECLCIESGNFKGLELLNEGVLEGIKNFITKIWNAIVKMWNKFVGRCQELFGQEQKFLESNKKIILEKQPLKADIKMYDYNLDKLTSLVFPKYDGRSIKEIKDEESFVAKILPNVGEKDSTVSDKVKGIIRGGTEEKSHNSSELNFKRMYDYCYSFGKAKETLRGDIKAFEDTKNNVLTVAQTTANKIEQEKPKEESTYSIVLGKYITEADITNATNTGNNSNNSTPKKDTNDKTVGGNIKNTTGDNPEDTTVEKDVRDANTSGKEMDEIQEAIKIYYKVGGEFLSAKLNVATEIFKNYMQVLRWHVNNFTTKTQTDKTKEKEEDYRNKPEENVVADKAL
jgi:chaperonin cofactor prefoldin